MTIGETSMRISLDAATEIADDLRRAAHLMREAKGPHPLDRACGEFCKCLVCRLERHAFTLDELDYSRPVEP